MIKYDNSNIHSFWLLILINVTIKISEIKRVGGEYL